MPKLCVFAGTTEGREIAEFLAGQSADVTVCVATEYGETLLPQGEGLHISARPLPREEMAELFRRERFDLVIDATHPYAKRITESIAATCAGTDTEYLRLLRPDTAAPENAVFVEDAAGAAEYLDRVDGNILLTTGSRELHAFASVRDFASRAYARVLPMEDSLRACREAGLPPAHILAMQGPFSAGMNAALIRQTGAEILVTKDTGATGGFAEKLAAARETGIKTLIIARPREESGRSLAEMQAFLREELGLAEEKKQTAPPRFPLFVLLEGRRCAVFGAGKIAARRAAVLRRFGACVTVTAPEKRAEIEINLCRGYEKSDLSGVFLAVAATDDRAVNHRIAEDCASLGIPVSVADSASESTFFFPAVCEGAELTAGVVSRGTSHAKTAEAARRIRRVLEEMT